MPNVLMLLVQSRKAVVALTTILSVTLVTVVGVLKDVHPESILGLIAAMTGICWKLMETIATEDHSRRLSVKEDHAVRTRTPAPANTPPEDAPGDEHASL